MKCFLILVLTLVWDYDFVVNPSVTNFNIYYGSSSGSYTNLILTNGTNISYTLSLPTNSYVVVTATDSNGNESSPSNELLYVGGIGILNVQNINVGNLNVGDLK